MTIENIPPQKNTISPELRTRAIPVINKYCTPEFQKHLLATECAMRALAKKFGGDEETWGLSGLLHDIDWEGVSRNAELHCSEKTKEILKEIEELPEEIVETVLSHYEIRGIPLDTLMKRALFAVDELTGLIVATALMNPEGLPAVKVKSVRKKFKDKAFAAGVNRGLILSAETNLELPLDELIEITLTAMQNSPEKLV